MTSVNEIKDLMKLAREAGLLEETKGQERLVQLLDAAILANDANLYQLLKQNILYLSRKALLDPFHRGKKSIIIGTADPFSLFILGKCGNLPIYLKPYELQEHMLVVGRTGAGKTNLFYHLMKQCLDMGIPFMAFDFKQDYRHLLKTSNDLLIVPWEKLRFNPLRPPPGVKPMRWLQILADVFADSQSLLSGSEDFLINLIHQLYELYGVLDETQDEGQKNYPSFYELDEALRYKHYPLITKEARYLETTMNRVRATVLALEPVLDCENGFPLENLLSKNIVLELEGLIADAQNFLVETILAWIYHYGLAQGQRNGLRHVLLFDEGKRIFDANKERRWEQGIPIIDLMTARLREFGEALVVSDQEPSKLTDSLKANTYTKILLSLGSGKDLQDMALSMGLSLNQQEIAYLLNTGEAVVKIASKDPVPMKIPEVQVSKDVTDDEVEMKLIPLVAQFEVTPRYRPDTFNQYLVQQAVSHKVKNKVREQETQRNTEQLSHEAKQLLTEIASHPFLSLTEHYQQLELSRRKGTQAREELLRDGLAQEVPLHAGRVGRETILLELTPNGRVLLERWGIKVNEQGRGGITHRFWQQQIKDYFEARGFKVLVEHMDIDVFAKNHESIAIQVSMDSRNELEDLKKALKEAEQVISASATEEIRSRLAELAGAELSQEELRRIKFHLVTDFWTSDKP